MAAPRACCHCHSLTVRCLAFGFDILYNFAVCHYHSLTVRNLAFGFDILYNFAVCRCHSLTVRNLAFGFDILYNFAVWFLFCPGAKGKRHNRNSVSTLEYSTFKER